MANPPFNVNSVDKDKIRDDPRFVFGIPNADNANYLWIQAFYSALHQNGRAGFVMANSASDARASERSIRELLLQTGAVDAIVSVASNFFYTVTNPCTLWFLDRAKANTPRRDQILFIDARSLFTQVDRAHREFSPQQIEFLANIVRLYRNEPIECEDCSDELLWQHGFKSNDFRDIAGFCKVASLKDVKAQGWSLNPGRYVGTNDRDLPDFEFTETLEALNEELEQLNAEALRLQDQISQTVVELLEAS
jgi:type I restriction enzyme M protein